MLNKYSDLNENALDALREIGNIGTGHATTALSAMTGKDIEIDIPLIRIISYKDAPSLLGGAEEFKVGILLRVNGLSGIFMFLLNEEFTKQMLETLLGTKVDDVRNLDELSSSAICETGNIMCCSYINAISKLTETEMTVSVPSICGDMVGALLSVPMILYGYQCDELMFIENRFQFDQKSFVSHILFLPELDALEHMLIKLGIPYE